MSSKNSRTASPSSPQQNVQTSKLPRFLQKAAARDRSKSVTDPTSQTTSPPASPSPEIQSTPNPGKTPRKAAKFLGMRDRQASDPPTTPETEEPPVIVEPVTIPRPRTRAERTSSSVPDSAMYSSSPSSSRIGDLPTRLSGWFSHTFSTSSTDLALPNILATHTSPKGKSNALLTAAKHGKGHLDKAVRYLLDSDSTPDKCTDPIWLLGVQHPGYEPSNPATPPNAGRQTSGSPNSFRSSTSSVASLSSTSNELSQSQTTQKFNPAANWPPVFYIDFTSRIWLTYRSHFPLPIKDGRLADLCGGPSQAAVPATPSKRSLWNLVGGEKTWSSDSGWGCMLRTGQSLLANALVHVHLGRDWRRPPYPVHTADYATYVHILTWFLDTPAPEAPFSVHRMALAGKELGTDVGQWFGPSVAAGAIKQLVNGCPEAGLGVGVAVDGVLYQTDVFAASHGDHYGRTPRRHKRSWGDRQVLVLVGIRLGIEGVNPIYYDTIKALYTFPQSVGIAGGRPSSSYYFVGAQADNLFYLDPHHARPAIPLRPPPPGPFPFQERETTPERVKTSSSHRRLPTSPSSTRTASSTFSYHAPVSPSPLQQQLSTSSNDTTSSTQTDSDAEIYISSRSPPPSLQPLHPPAPASSSHHGRWRSASHPPASPGASDLGLTDLAELAASTGLDPVQLHYCTAYTSAELKTFHCERVRKMPLSGLDPSMLLGFLVRDEADWADLRKRISGLPRMIFSIQDEPPSWPTDSEDDLGLLSISEPDIDIEGEDDDGVEKVEVDEDEDERMDEDEEDEQYFDTRSASASSPSLSSGSGSQGRPHHHHQKRQQQQQSGDKKKTDSERSKSEDNDTEEDPVDPVTPGPHSKFSIIDLESVKKGVAAEEARARRKAAGELLPEEDSDGEGTGDIEDDWVEPSIPTPMPQHTSQMAYPMGPSSSTSSSDANERQRSPRVPSSSHSKSKSSHGTSSGVKKSGRKSGKKQVPVPVPSVRGSRKEGQEQEHYPFPVAAAAAGAEEEEDDLEEPPSFEEGGRRTTASTMKAKRMHNARAKDGGRTQSGGVKGLLVDDL